MGRPMSAAVAAAVAMFLLGSVAVQAQTQAQGTGQAQPERVTTPCALVCLPPTHLNAEKCKCEESTPVTPPPCALVCPDPDSVLDTKACWCLTK
jgi:hypothetical protein